MEEKKGFKLPPYVMLMLVAIVMSAAIAGVYSMTKDTIEAAALAAQAAARTAVMEDAADMTELPLEEGAPVDYCYEAYDAAGNVIGYVSQITVVGFGGEIEVTVGLDTAGTITAINVGGSNFSETSGLGAKTREPAFTDQFKGMSGMLVLKQNIDSVTGASVSSGAVVSGVNKAVDYMKSFLPEDPNAQVEELPLTDEQAEAVLPGAENVRWMGGGSGIDGWWQADNGYIVRATGFGEGPIAVTMGFDENNAVAGIIIGDENFMETEGRGDRVLEDWYKEQFLGRTGAQEYGDGLDAISGATVTSDATLAAINACMTFDPATGVSAAPAPEDTLPDGADAVTEASIPEEEEASQEADAVTEASIPEEEESASQEADAVTEASIPEEEEASQEADAVTEASIPEEESAAPAVEAADAVTEASIPEEEETAAPIAEAATEEPDAVTEASIPEEEEAIIPAAPVVEPVIEEPDAVTEASIPEEEEAIIPAAPAVEPVIEEADAVTEASIPEEEEAVIPAAPVVEPVIEAPDAVTEASIPEEEEAIIPAAPAAEPVIEAPDAVTEASIPEEEEAIIPAAPVAESVIEEPDAVTEASIPEEEEAVIPAAPVVEPVIEAPDAVTEASIPEEEEAAPATAIPEQAASLLSLSETIRQMNKGGR